jgi:GWxTD domain-containing protein
MALLVHSMFSFSQARPVDSNANKTKERIFHKDGGIPPFKTWLEQDVAWIITTEERSAFKLLKNDEERDQFIEAFWARRDPTPDTYENEYKEEHYRRIVYANDHFGSQAPGWKTDRGRIYILYGPPDDIDSSAEGKRPQQTQTGEDYSQLPVESWRYRYVEGVGQEVAIDFVDVCNCGDFRMRMPPDLKDALLYVPDGGVGSHGRPKQSVDPKLYLTPVNTPRARLRDLEAKLDSKVESHALAYEVYLETVKATDITSFASFTISFQRSDIPLIEQKNGSHHATLNVLGRVRTLTGRVVEMFEDTLKIDDLSTSEPTLRRSLPLMAGRYKIEIVVQDPDNNEWGTWARVLRVEQ